MDQATRPAQCKSTTAALKTPPRIVENEQLSVFTSGVTSVAREAGTVGKLGGQAVPSAKSRAKLN